VRGASCAPPAPPHWPPRPAQLTAPPRDATVLIRDDDAQRQAALAVIDIFDRVRAIHKAKVWRPLRPFWRPLLTEIYICGVSDLVQKY
jgi:hypothetical protein